MAPSASRPTINVRTQEASVGEPRKDFDDLSIDEQIQHVQDLWERIASHPDRVPLTDAQRDELRRRLAEHRANPETGASWDVVRDRLLAKQ